MFYKSIAMIVNELSQLYSFRALSQGNLLQKASNRIILHSLLSCYVSQVQAQSIRIQFNLLNLVKNNIDIYEFDEFVIEPWSKYFDKLYIEYMHKYPNREEDFYHLLENCVTLVLDVAEYAPTGCKDWYNLFEICLDQPLEDIVLWLYDKKNEYIEMNRQIMGGININPQTFH